MPAIATLAFSGANHLRFLITTDGSTQTMVITTTGAGPENSDVKTALGASAGVLQALLKAPEQGYGQVKPVAGALTQAKARGLWLSDRSGTDADPAAAGNKLLPTALCQITPASGAGVTWLVDANVATGIPVINVTGSAAGTAYLDIFIPGSIGA